MLSALIRLRSSAASQFERIRKRDKGMQKLKQPTADEDGECVIAYNSRHIATTADCESTKESTFLGLPAELRDQIYEAALIERDAIKVSKSALPPEPGLLRVNTQIRKEAQDIYYSKNLFRFPILDYDATILIRWLGSTKARAASDWETKYSGRKDWTNLHAWIKATYDGKTNGVHVARSLDGKPSVVAGVFNIVMRMKDNRVPWGDVEEYLDDIRRLLTVKDSSWGGLRVSRRTIDYRAHVTACRRKLNLCFEDSQKKYW